MQTQVTKIKKEMNETVRFVAAAAVLFAACLCFVPEAGIMRTVPFFLLGGAVSELLNVRTGGCVALSGVFTVCAYLVRGSSVSHAVIFALLSMILAFEGMYAVKLVRIALKTQKSSVRNKCILMTASGLVVSAVLSLVMCGNAVSFYKSDADNTSHIALANKHLGEESVKKEYTSYAALDGEYRTYVTFRDGDSVIGAENDCYVSMKNGVLTDSVRDYYEDKMLKGAEKTLSNAVISVTSAFEVTASDVVLENGEYVLPSADYKDYASRVGYVVSFYSILEKEDDFLSLCEDVMKQLEKTDFTYKEIVFCGGNASDVLYAAQLLPGMDFDTLSSKYSGNFDDFKHVNLEEDYGVTEQTVLDYWNNN